MGIVNAAISDIVTSNAAYCVRGTAISGISGFPFPSSCKVRYTSCSLWSCYREPVFLSMMDIENEEPKEKRAWAAAVCR